MDSLKNSPPPEAKLHFLDYWRVIRIRKAIIITVFLITAIIATAVTFILPESYASTCNIKVENDVNDSLGGMEATPSMMPYDPYFIQTTFEIMQSQMVLTNVINALDLNVVWGKKYSTAKRSRPRRPWRYSRTA
jgi:polysaccharide biosynthesis transport protein